MELFPINKIFEWIDDSYDLVVSGLKKIERKIVNRKIKLNYNSIFFKAKINYISTGFLINYTIILNKINGGSNEKTLFNINIIIIGFSFCF